MRKKLQNLLILPLLALAAMAPLAGCKDTGGATTEAAKLEECKVKSDEKDWDKAIKACEAVGNDEAKHLLAQAYMGRAGLDFFGLLSRIGTSSKPMTLILDAVPRTTAKSDDYYTALSIIMDDIQVKDETMYLEAIVLSSMLVYEQLKDLFELKAQNNSLSTCADSSLTDCSFTFTLTKTSGYTTGLTFGGLGADFYDALCKVPGSTTQVSTKTTKVHTVTNYVTDLSSDKDIDYDMTIYGCDIKAKSPLAYNRTAGKKLAGNQVLGDALDQLKMTEALDAGNNFSQSVTGLRDDIMLCNSGHIEPPTQNDGVLNDCEILGYLTNQ